MTQKEKLLDLIHEFGLYGYQINDLTDYLLANGVVVLPCRCRECEHCDIGQNDVEQWCVCQVKRIDVDPTSFCSHAKRKGGE